MEGQAWTVRLHGLGHQVPVWGAAQEAKLAEDPKNPLSSFKMSARERIWKHFSNSSIGQMWGRGSTWREYAGLHMQEWVRADIPMSFHCGILICTRATWLFLHLNDVSVFG